MTYQGIVRNGQVIVAGGVALPEGAAVEFDVRPASPPETKPSNTAANGSPDEAAEPVGKLLLRFAGICDGLPPDLAERHDHYIHGRDEV